MKEIFKKTIIFIIKIESKLILWRHKPNIIAITGNVGKTSTKDAIYTVLADSLFIRKSEKSFNSDIGIPLTIMGCHNGLNNPIIWIKNILKGIVVIIKRKYPDWLILEVGADRPGDIENIAKWLRPDIVVYTKIGKTPVHVEYFESRDHLINEKAKLLEYMKSLPDNPGGLLILNQDDEDILALKEKAISSISTYGMTNGANVLGSNYEIFYNPEGFPKGINFRVNHGGNSVPVEIEGVLGIQHVYPVLAAMAVGINQGLNLVSMSESLKKHKGPKGRMNLIKGIKNTLIIDDSYNSSPTACFEAINTLRMLKSKGRKVAVLGDMMELGKYSIEEHKNIGEIVSKSVDVLITVGIRAKFIAEGALNNGMSEKNIFQYEDSKEAGKYLEIILNENDVVLIKGSQSIRMERAVEEVMAYPLEKERKLVRQESDWKNK